MLKLIQLFKYKKTSLSKRQKGKQSVFYFQMPLADYDFFALRSYSFAMRKTNSFFSLGTILLSLLIIALSVVINLNTIRHLWLPKSQVNINVNKFISPPGTLTSTLACVQPINYTSSQPFPAIKLKGSNFQSIPFKMVSEAEVAVSNPRLKAHIGTNFICMDLTGLQLPDYTYRLYFEVAWKSAKLFITANSYLGMTNDTWVAPVQAPIKQNIYSYGRYIPVRKAKFIEGNIRDKLYINYEPQRIVTFKQLILDGIESIPLPNTYVLSNTSSFLNITIYQPFELTMTTESNYNLMSVSIERYDISFILGCFLSWLSIFTLLFSYVVGPIMDASLNLVLIQTIFHLDPSTRKPSTFKFLIASLKSGIFQKQDKFIKINDKLEKLKDINFILKLQLLLTAITPNRTQEKDAIVVSEHSFGDPKEEVGIQTYEESVNNRLDIFEGSEDEEKISLITKMRQKLFKFLDTGSDSISINFQGNGYGSVLSLLLTLLFIGGLLTFFVIFGLLKSTTTTQDVNVVTYQDLTYTIKKDDIFLATQYSDTPIDFYFMDGSYKTIGTVPFKAYSDCQSRMPSRMKSETSGWVIYCLADDVELVKSAKKQNQRFIFADVRDYSMDKYLWLYYESTDIRNGVPVQISRKLDLLINDFNQDQYNQCTEMGIKMITYKNDTDTYSFSDYLTPLRPVLSKSSFKKRGFYYRLIGQRQITISTSTFFDIIQNLWSLATLCITMVLIKLTKYINLRKKEQVLSSERSEYRDNICILLSKLNGLLQGKSRKEIQSLKYYIKTPFQKVV